MQPNRLERAWKKIKPEILARWPGLSEGELDRCGFQFDQIVEMIRKTYFPGRSHLTLEGQIRDWLDTKLSNHERTERHGA